MTLKFVFTLFKKSFQRRARKERVCFRICKTCARWMNMSVTSLLSYQTCKRASRSHAKTGYENWRMSFAKPPLLTLTRISFLTSFEIDFWLLFDVVLRVFLKALMALGSGSGTPWRSFFRDRGRPNQDFCVFALRWKLAILLGPPMQNGHFYFCTPDIVGIRFLKSGDFARDILTVF